MIIRIQNFHNLFKIHHSVLRLVLFQIKSICLSFDLFSGSDLSFIRDSIGPTFSENKSWPLKINGFIDEAFLQLGR